MMMHNISSLDADIAYQSLVEINLKFDVNYI
jgi:hypothetical protein